MIMVADFEKINFQHLLLHKILRTLAKFQKVALKPLLLGSKKTPQPE